MFPGGGEILRAVQAFKQKSINLSNQIKLSAHPCASNFIHIKFHTLQINPVSNIALRLTQLSLSPYIAAFSKVLTKN